ncbi:MAG: hypothetical protein HY602_02300 [Parcubacteria group bacterium]|nr:hypothetical protein [Parcubacteria group bacterium]
MFILLFLLCQIIIFGSIFYYVFDLGNPSILIILGLIIGVTGYFRQYLKLFHGQNAPGISMRAGMIQKILFGGSYLFCASAAFFILYHNRAAESIRSPWEAVPYIFFIAYFLATLILVYILHRYQGLYFLAAVHFFLSAAVALIIYKLGFGFDPIIHQATEKVIAQQGFITPKPFYYIGQYSLVVFLHKILRMPIQWIDSLLVPLLFALIPFLLHTALSALETKLQKPISRILLLAPLLIPFPFFIVTTPYNLAILFLLFSLITAFIYTQTGDFRFLILQILLALSALFIHPLAGVPAVIAAIFILKPHTSRLGGSVLILFSSFAIPSLFIINNWLSGTAPIIAFNLEHTQWLPAFVPRGILPAFNIFYDFVYFWGQNLLILCGILAAIGFYLFYKIK